MAVVALVAYLFDLEIIEKVARIATASTDGRLRTFLGYKGYKGYNRQKPLEIKRLRVAYPVAHARGHRLRILEIAPKLLIFLAFRPLP